MLISKILRKKRILIDKIYNKEYNDLVYSTFRFPVDAQSSGIVVVGDYENMRPDTLCNRLYADQSKWDAMLKFNGISNPFSLKAGDILYSTNSAALDASYMLPRAIFDRGERDESTADAMINPLNNIDSDRQSNLSNKKGELPPNISRVGDKNVKVKDGRLIFGDDVTSVNKDNCPVPISRTRLKMALTKNKLFG